MAKRPSFQFYPRDFLADPPVTVMSCEEVGAYLLLLMWQWAEGSVPNDLADAIPSSRASRKRVASMLAHLDPCFPTWEDGKRRNRRMERVRAEREEYVARQRANGSRGGRPRNNPEESGGFFDGNPNETQPITQTEAKKTSASASASALQEQHKKRVVLDPPTPLRAKRPKPEPKEFAIPDWVPAKEWQDYVDMRLLIRKPIGSPSQAEYCIRALDKLRKQGHDPGEVLGQSVAYRWQGLFELKNQNGGQNGKLSYAEQTRRNAAIALERIEARAASAGRSE